MNSAAEVQTPAAAVGALENSVPGARALETIAHELRQPLSAIESIAYYLSLVLPRHEHRAREQVSRLQQLVEQSNWILGSGLQLANETPLAPEPLDLGELITETVASTGWHGDPQPQLNLADGLRLVRLDPGRARLLVENLLTLFRQFSSHAHPMRVATSQNESGVCLEILTSAPGYRSESSLGPGSGLSLLSVRRVVESHRGTCEFIVNPTAGIAMRVVLP